MSMSVNSVSASSLLNFPTASSKGAAKSSRAEVAEGDMATSTAADEVAASAEAKKNAKLAKIKEEIKQSPVMPSTEKIVAKYGITSEEAAQVLSEACLEVATNAGGSPEQVTKLANAMYLLAEVSDSDVVEVLDISKLLKGAAAKKGAESSSEQDEGLSAQQIADKYDVPIEKAQEMVAQIEKSGEGSSSSSLSTVDSVSPESSANGDLAIGSTYSVSNSGLSGPHGVSINNNFPPCISTVSYSA